MSIEAMKQALEALEEVQKYDKTSEWFEKKVSALRQAIAEAEKQEPVAQAWDEGYRTGINDERMSEANIGIAGFGAKVEPARNNPYRTPPAAPVHASDMSEKHVHESDKDRHEFAEMVKKGTKAWADTPDDWVDELRGGAEKMERNADYERGFIDGRADQMKSSVDRAVNRMAPREWVGLDDDIPGLGLVTEEFYNGMICAEDILRKKNT